jgi:AcrR family transcriptional regulator
MSKKRDIRIHEIIDAAINEFIEKGYEKTSMESIAKRAKLSKGGLYHHFKSKVEILFMVNMKFLEPIQEFMTKVENDKSIVNGLNQFITNYLNYWDTHKRELTLSFLIMNVSFSDPQIMELYKESTSQTFNFFEAQFIKGHNQGVFKKIDARSHAIALISCLDGYLGYMLIDSSISTENIDKEIKNTFINNILKQIRNKI